MRDNRWHIQHWPIWVRLVGDIWPMVVSIKISLQEAALTTQRFVANLALMIAAGLLVIAFALNEPASAVLALPRPH